MTVPVFWGCYFPIYEHAKRVAASGALRDQSLWVQHVAAAVAAGACSDALTNPLWVIRTRLQTNALRTGGAAAGAAQSSMINEARLILRNEGLTVRCYRYRGICIPPHPTPTQTPPKPHPNAPAPAPAPALDPHRSHSFCCWQIPL